MKIACSCFVDSKPKYEWQAFLLIHSLIHNAGYSPEDIKVHCVPAVTTSFRNAMHNQKVNIFNISSFSANYPYCNKIQQCFSNVFSGYDKVILLDCDLFFLSTPNFPSGSMFSAKIVDLPNPPLGFLQNIYRKANVNLSREVPANCALSKDELTIESNLNGGLYFIDTTLLDPLGREWKKYANWLFIYNEYLGQYKRFIDQIAMALALDELGVGVTLLPAQLNFPVHLPITRMIPIVTDAIDVLHYHSNFLSSGLIGFTGLPEIDKAISKANTDIDTIIRTHFDNSLFWNMRYDLFPDLGSGLGSRGETLIYKQAILRNITRTFESKTVIDVGCGDLETTKDLKFQYYTGYDSSSKAIDISRNKRPDWNFIHGGLSDATRDTSDLVICLDVLIHQKKEIQYRELISRLVSAARQRLVVSGFNALPTEYISNITAFHEPLRETLVNTGAFNEILEVGKYRETSIFVADKTKTGEAVHTSDLPIEIFDALSPFVDRRDLLRLIIDISREYFGFFTNTSSRILEYPWIIEKLSKYHSGSHILDIGAGVSPVPIVLADRSLVIDTVNRHPITRHRNTGETWNEWGYLNYSEFSQNIKSFHKDIVDYRPSTQYDAIYSISALEHMPRNTWETTIALISTMLRPGCAFLLTLDLIPGSNDLWNLSENRIVDADVRHVTLDEVIQHLLNQGFLISEYSVRREIPYSKTDVAFIECRRKN